MQRDEKMIKPKLHHVTMKTSHLDHMIDWYGKVIGAKVQFQIGRASCRERVLRLV